MSIVLAFEDDDEFVAADAVDRAVLVDAADGLAQALQSDVPLFVAKAVVDVLELVQVDHDHGKGSLAGGDFLVEVVDFPVIGGDVLDGRQFILIGLFLHGADVFAHPFHRIVHMAGKPPDFILSCTVQRLVIFAAAQAAGGFTDVMQGPDDTVRRPDSQERRQQADDDGHSQDPEGHELAAGIDFPFRCRHAQFHAILQGRKAHGHGNALIVVMNQMGIRR